MDALIALHHPTRRRLYEVLRSDGPSTVSQLVVRTGLAAGSISHHLKPLHRNGFIEPAPELAKDTRESWWRAHHRSLEWDSDDFNDGAGRQVSELAEQINFDHQTQATASWLRNRQGLPSPWSGNGFSSDTFVHATADQLEDLQIRVNALIREWTDGCLADRTEHPDTDRHPVRFIARGFPSDPSAS